MVTEEELALLSFDDAPRMITASVPGPEARKLLDLAAETESMARGGGRFPLVFDQGRGATVRDPDGNTYIDLNAGVAVNAVGRCHPRVTAAIREQTGRLMHAADLCNTRRTELAKRLSAIMPTGLRDNCVTYFTQSGSGAVETAIKFARRITGRGQIVAFHGAYHGVWCGSGSLTTGDQYRRGYGPFMPGVIHAPYPYFYRCPFKSRSQEESEQRCADYLDYLLNTPYTGADDVGAVIIEPQQGEGGYIMPSGEFIQRVKESCRKHGALFIADEIQAGAGRSGRFWSIDYSGAEPDMLVWGKGMGGDIPMAGLSLRRDLACKIDDHSQPNTFAGNAMSAAGCLANIEILTDPEQDLIGRAAALGAETKEQLQSRTAEMPLVGEVRGRGLMIGVELVSDRTARTPLDPHIMAQITVSLLQKGIIMVPCGRYGNVLRLMPPLTITRAHLQKGVDGLLEVLTESSPVIATDRKRLCGAPSLG